MLSVILALLCITGTTSFQGPLRVRHVTIPSSRRLDTGRISAAIYPLNATNAYTFREDPILFGLPWYSNEYRYDEGSDDDYDDEYMDVDISFLPLNVYVLPPKTDYILRKLTQTYIKSGIETNPNEIDLSEVLQVIDEEYKEASVPLLDGLGNNFYFDKSLDDPKKAEAQQMFSKVLSFAAMYRLPKDMAIMLFGLKQQQTSSTSTLDPQIVDELKSLTSKFETGSWSSVSFPQGLSIRLKREYMLSRRAKYFPVPRSSIFTRSADAIEASDAIRQAQNVKLPPKFIQKQEVVAQIDEIERELRKTFEFPKGDTLFKDMINFFPRQNKVLRRIGRVTSKPMMELRTIGQAWLLSYCVLNILWFTLGILCRWKHFGLESSTILVQGKFQALQLSFKKFAKAFVSTHIGNRNTSLMRVVLAIVLTPFGKRMLEYAGRKLNQAGGTDHAARILPFFLAVSCFGLWALIIIADSTFSKTSIGTFAM